MCSIVRRVRLKNLPNAEIRFVPSGHFALESHHMEISRLMKEFLGSVIKRLTGKEALD